MHGHPELCNAWRRRLASSFWVIAVVIIVAFYKETGPTVISTFVHNIQRQNVFCLTAPTISADAKFRDDAPATTPSLAKDPP